MKPSSKGSTSSLFCWASMASCVLSQSCRITSTFESFVSILSFLKGLPRFCPSSNLQIVPLQSPHGMATTNENLSSSLTPSEQPSTILPVYCKVCGSQATDHLHYGALVCYACRAFFRRQVIKSHLLPCAYNDICVVTKETKDRCPYCRFQKCLQAGMKPGWVMDKQDLEQKRKKASIKKNLGLNGVNLTADENNESEGRPLDPTATSNQTSPSRRDNSSKSIVSSSFFVIGVMFRNFRYSSMLVSST